MGEGPGLVDFARLTRRLRVAAGVCGAAALLAAGAAAARGEALPAAVLRWASVGVVGFLVTAAVLAGVQALRAALAARARGEPLGDPEARPVPRRREPQ